MQKTRQVLIETYWNVKKIRQIRQLMKKLRINRNILECKVIFCTITTVSVAVLIETYWNVKLRHMNILGMILQVLIETYWNVKTFGSSGLGSSGSY